MFFLTIACSACSLTPPPWILQFVNPAHVYLAWAIVLLALFAVALPFLNGYRLDGHVPYSLRRHLILTLVLGLFPFGFDILSPYPLSFGKSLLELFYLPLYILHDLLFSALAFGQSGIPLLLSNLLLYLIYCIAAAWIMLKVDRFLYKKQATVVDPGIK